MENTILGLDLGSNSIGWALFEAKEQRPVRLIDCGVRVFEEGLEGIEADGKGKSRNVARREARLRRRQCDRKARRLAHLARLLQRSGLLPSGKLNTPEERHEFFTQLDKTLLPPLQLRAEALARKLEANELGRAFYHLGQRRGFLSNRKSAPKKDEDKGVIKQEIAGLEKEIKEAGAQTLGEHFNKLNSEGVRVRVRHTARKMYEDEFGHIWEAQRLYYPDILTDELKKKMYKAIYFQRPLKSQKELIGLCELEEGKKRAPWALLAAQRFRYLQKVNDLRVNSGGDERPLTKEERNSLIQALENIGDMTFAGRGLNIKKLLNLKSVEFNLERGGEKKLPGNRTAKALRDIFKDRWDGFTVEEKNAVVDEIRSTVKDDILKKRGVKAWGLDEEAAQDFAEISLEDGYCNYSKLAIGKLMPLLEKGMPLASAIKEMYQNRRDKTINPLRELPPVRQGLAEIRNPLVERALTELRRVVNAVVDKHGQPGVMRIELARDLKRPAKEREQAWKNMRANEKKREEAARKILAEPGNGNPSRNDILKVLLWEECNGKCPYTGRPISMTALLGDNPQFDIEHIIPFDRSLDDSYVNKTLCYAEENREVKKGRTPFEAYGERPEWSQILERVKNFKGDAAREKYRRFNLTEAELEEILKDFSSRQLNDTRYATRLAKGYLGLLYGGLDDDGIDAEGKRRVQAATGQVTAHIRNALDLNRILNDGPRKSRDDHRHHAVDAVAIALADTAMIKQLSDAAKNRKGRRLFAPVRKPWENFFEDVRKDILGITVSKRVSNRVRGALHKETFYSPPKTDDKGKKYVLVRTGLADLSKKDIETGLDYLDERVRDCILEKLNGGEAKKVFAHPEDHPVIKTKDGREIPIHKIRIRQSQDVFAVGKGDSARYVQADSIHHMEIIRTKDKNGNEKWEGFVVDMLEAYRRLHAKEPEPVIKRDHGENKEFVFSLAGGEIIELDELDKTGRGLYVVRTVPKSRQIYFTPLADARILKDIGKKGLTAYPETLKERHCRKVVVTPLGEVRRAND
ncbi:MAG: type II CRISPR RNA-guided endonuclease Cas9 [Actinomycetota bacterium]|nr:type II CRISPR RNA-guided endonuclease Cas9 [Actinomycetota bacterium]